MIECARRARLAEEPLAYVTVEVLRGERKLQCDGATEVRVDRSIDHAHASRRERLEDAEVGDRLAHELKHVAVRAPFRGRQRVRGAEYRVDVAEAGRVRVLFEQLLERTPGSRVGRADRAEPFGSRGGIQLHQRIERGAQLRPLSWIGGLDHLENRRKVRVLLEEIVIRGSVARRQVRARSCWQSSRNLRRPILPP